jgi:hypothetical protein
MINSTLFNSNCLGIKISKHHKTDIFNYIHAKYPDTGCENIDQINKLDQIDDYFVL